MSKSESTKAKLEAAFERFEAIDPGHEYYSTEYLDDPNCFELYKIAGEIVDLSTKLMVESLPPRIFQVAYSCPPHSRIKEMKAKDAQHRSFVSFLRRVSLLEAAIFGDDGEATIRPVLQGLHEISHGGESPYIGKSAFEGKGNRLPLQVAVHRMAALEAYRAGRSLGVPASELQQKISVAYGTAFDTIRKWESYCRKIVSDPSRYDDLTRYGESRWRELFESGLAFGKLDEIGKQYREIWRKARK